MHHRELGDLENHSTKMEDPGGLKISRSQACTRAASTTENFNNGAFNVSVAPPSEVLGSKKMAVNDGSTVTRFRFDAPVPSPTKMA